jgi:hypothetical protein
VASLVEVGYVKAIEPFQIKILNGKPESWIKNPFIKDSD